LPCRNRGRVESPSQTGACFQNTKTPFGNEARLSQPQRVAGSTYQENFMPPGHAQVLRLGQPRSNQLVILRQNHFENTPWGTIRPILDIDRDPEKRYQAPGLWMF
jgi:hypothetical protein